MSRRSKNLSWFDIAEVLLSSARLLNTFSSWLGNAGGTSQAAIHNRQILALNSQRLTNLEIDARLKEQRAAKLSNEVVMTDARAELEYQERLVKLETQKLKNMQLRIKLQSQGAFTSDFAPADYPDPTE